MEPQRFVGRRGISKISSDTYLHLIESNEDDIIDVVCALDATSKNDFDEAVVFLVANGGIVNVDDSTIFAMRAVPDKLIAVLSMKGVRTMTVAPDYIAKPVWKL